MNVIDLTQRDSPIMQKIRATRDGPTRSKLYREADSQGIIVDHLHQWGKPLIIEAAIDKTNNTIHISNVEFITKVRLHLDHTIIDVSKPLTVRHGAKYLLRRKTLEASCSTILKAFAETKRRDAIWSVDIPLAIRP